jgi:hypothetical protein
MNSLSGHPHEKDGSNFTKCNQTIKPGYEFTVFICRPYHNYIDGGTRRNWRYNQKGIIWNEEIL